ncbi:hypothetical protein [Spongorhabdus nitratireducens]
MGKVKKYSATRLVADALKVDEKLIPESLRNRINTYKNNKTIPQAMFEVTQGHHYNSVEYKTGNLTYIRNLVILDTLFDNSQHVKKIMLNSLESCDRKKLLDDLLAEIDARRNILNAMGSQLGEIKSVLMQDNIDLATQELPDPFSRGHSVSTLLISQIQKQPSEQVSLYDRVLEQVLCEQYDIADELLAELPVKEVASPQFLSLKKYVSSRVEAAKAYHSFLKNL